MDQEESGILEALDLAVRSEAIRPSIDAIVARVEQKLRERPDDVLAWEPIPLDFYTAPLPETIRSSWVFILRANTSTGAERHPNSHQRMMSYRGSGDFQTRPEGDWCSHLLKSDPTVPVAERWISIPPNVWHQGVVPGENWVVVSFHTAAEHELIEERLVTEAKDAVRQRKYAESREEVDVSQASQLLRSAPYFPVADVEQSVDHYERVLGFHREYVAGTPPEFAILSRDGLPIMLRLVPAPEHIRPNEKQGGTWDVFFWVRDVRALHAELRANGADVVYGPIVQEAYQMEEFAVRDREGYVLGFGQALGQPSPHET